MQNQCRIQNVEYVEHSSNYSKVTGCLWFYSKHEATNFNEYIVNNNNFKPFKDKAKLLENTRTDGANGAQKNTKNVVSLKFLSNF